MTEFHHSIYSTKKQYVSALQILWTAKQMLYNAISRKLIIQPNSSFFYQYQI